MIFHFLFSTDYDYDYDYVPIDHCDTKKTSYDLNENGQCNHTFFNQLPQITAIEQFSGTKKMKQCCPNHGYLHSDNCEVTIDIEPAFISYKFYLNNPN